MGDISAEGSQQVGNRVVVGRKDSDPMLKHLILVFFPGKQLGSEGSEKEKTEHQKNGTSDFSGTLIFDDLR
jgi:hypothetical protein